MVDGDDLRHDDSSGCRDMSAMRLMAGGVHKALSSRSGESDPLVTMGYTPPAATTK